MIDENTHKIMEAAGWTIECESPLEVSNSEGSFASGYPAQLLIDDVLNEHEMELREARIAEYAEVNRKYMNKEINLDEFLLEIKNLTDKA